MGWLAGLLATYIELFFYKTDTISKQLPLLRTVAKVKNLNTVYVRPSNNYEKFIERHFQRNIHTNKAKSVIVRDAQIEWKKT